MFVIGGCAAVPFAKEHIPVAVSMKRRQVLASGTSIPRNKSMQIDCITGSLSAQAGFALRGAG